MMPKQKLLGIAGGMGLAAGLALCLAGCASVSRSPAPPTAMSTVDLPSLQAQAARFNLRLTLPEFETTPEAVQRAVQQAIAQANARLDAIGKLDRRQLSFANTFRALDDTLYAASLTANRVSLLKETHPQAALREACAEAEKTIQEWWVGLDYREDVYATLQAFADTQPRLEGEDAKLMAETLRDYRRAGLALPRAQRDEVERLRKELARLMTDFQSNITKARAPVKFTRAELEGVPDLLLQQPGIKTGEDEYTLLANVTFQYQMVMENCRVEATRRKLTQLRYNLAREANVPLLRQILELRATIAQKLGYATWADYQIEPKMAKNAATARAFLEQLKTGLQPKFEAELKAFQELKARDTGNPNARIELWDTAYYMNQLKKERHAVDAEKLRDYFPYQRVLEGMFAIYQQMFGLRIAEVTPPAKWVDDLKLYAVTDAATGEPLGLLYLDMFPREGKYNHFAHFSLIEGKRLPDGTYQRPVSALICNFPPPSPDKPSLLSHADVETLFHEFGHAMHCLLTRANHARFSGTSVPRDFVEAPSQMLENWVWDKAVLDTFAGHYQDPSRKIPQDILAQLKAAKRATIATYYRRQLTFGLLDLKLHMEIRPGAGQDPVQMANDVFREVFLPVPEDTAFVAYFGHLMGYDAAYYGYAWADAIAADMATLFENSPQRYFDTQLGRKLRDEIYAPGDSRDVNLSIERFLGRPRSLAPFLKELGLETPAAN
ncbi:Zn-dependent oligopeptidase [Fontisphaera persica]|uniref:M3 family metallopeptidase n=1 Tax=Fontisphaera persica TaxID=2974023 RepID=UPI0024BF19A3|nr:M3 family metallopeptidase [Fontisphaera persica]WCJ58398.1 Zn-dependent oligopeptidase [Fontisphaera persica]